jgi:hypothetical protein
VDQRQALIAVVIAWPLACALIVGLAARSY